MDIQIKDRINDVLKDCPSICEIKESDSKIFFGVAFLHLSGWKWFVSNYDSETMQAFGFVVGIEPEWGYFNMYELVDSGVLYYMELPSGFTFSDVKESFGKPHGFEKWREIKNPENVLIISGD